MPRTLDLSTMTTKQLYAARRRAATAANGSGMKAMRAWGDLAIVEEKLRQIEPDGDWRYEARNFETGKWEVQR